MRGPGAGDDAYRGVSGPAEGDLPVPHNARHDEEDLLQHADRGQKGEAQPHQGTRHRRQAHENQTQER